jgi:hypothetical protein
MLHILAYIVLIPLALIVLWYGMFVIIIAIDDIVDWRSEKKKRQEKKRAEKMIEAMDKEHKKRRKNIKMFKQEMRNAGVTEKELDYELERYSYVGHDIFERMTNPQIKERVQEYLENRKKEENK